MQLTGEQQSKILHDAARECGMDGHIVTAGSNSELCTMAENAMCDWRGNPRTPHKNSYLFLDSVDACFYIDRSGTPRVAFTACWTVNHSDLEPGKMEKAAILMNKMLNAVQKRIDEALEEPNARD